MEVHYLFKIFNNFQVQLKGSGLSPFSRHADGRAVLRSSIREYLASEFLFHNNIPTSRALSLAISDQTIARDPLYTGNVIDEKMAVVARVAPHFLRFGTMENALRKDCSLEWRKKIS